MPIIMEEEEGLPIITPSSSTNFPKQKVNAEIIGSKRNHASHASRKRIQAIINSQATKDKLLDLRKNINQIIDEGSNNYYSPLPAASTLVAFHHVNPKGHSSPPPKIPTITQDYPSQISIHPATLPPPLPGAPNECDSSNPMDHTSSTPTRSTSLSAAPCSMHIQLSDPTAIFLAPPWQRQ